MQYITGTERTQAVLFSQSLDEIIDSENEVRIVDLFVESIELAQFGFTVKQSAEGRPLTTQKICWSFMCMDFKQHPIIKSIGKRMQKKYRTDVATATISSGS